MPEFKLGKRHARLGAVKMKFGDYFAVDDPNLPVPPTMFGRPWLVDPNWNMLANDKIGDCVWAAFPHVTMLWRRESGAPVASFTDQTATADYAAATGYDPSDPSTDQGTDLAAAMAWWRKTGITDDAGKKHAIDAYASVSLNQAPLAAYLCGALVAGVQLPGSAMDQFNAGQPWTSVPGSMIEGGHCVPVIGRNRLGLWLVVTWGRIQGVADEFFQRYMDEAYAPMSLERLRNNVSPLGYSEDAIKADVVKLTS